MQPLQLCIEVLLTQKGSQKAQQKKQTEGITLQWKIVTDKS